MPDHKSLTDALVAFQAELPDVSKGGNNPAFKSKYATLPDVTKAVFPILTKHGLAWVTLPDVTEHGPVLRWELRHTSGDSLTGVWPLPDAVKAQELGSWLTYGRRYCLSAVTGITPDEDDDGNTATSPARVGRSQGRAQPSAKERIRSAANALYGAQSRGDLESIWDRVKAGGLDGIDELVDLYTDKKGDLQGTPEPLVDRWEAAPIPGAEVPS